MVSNSVTDLDDTDLVHRFIHQHDDEAFRLLVERHQRNLYKFVWQHVASHDDVADICQKTFIQAFTKIKQFRGKAAFKTWLYQIAINQCKNHYRTQQRQRIDDIPLDKLSLVQEDRAMTETKHAEERNTIQSILHLLPEKQRYTVFFRIYHGLSYQETAEIMGCPVGTVKANYNHALATIRKHMKGNISDGDW